MKRRLITGLLLWAPSVLAYPTVQDNPSVRSTWFEPSTPGSFTRYQWQSDPMALDAIAFAAQSLIYDAGHLQCDLLAGSSLNKFDGKSCSALPLRCPRFSHQSSALASGSGDTTLKGNVVALLSSFSAFNYCGMAPQSGAGLAPEAIWGMLGYQPSAVVNSSVFNSTFGALLGYRENFNSTPVPSRAYAVDTYAVLPRSLRRQAVGVMKQYLSDAFSKVLTSNGVCPAYSQGSGNMSNVHSVRDVMEPAYYYDCAYQSGLGDNKSFQPRDSGNPHFKNLTPYTSADSLQVKVRKEGVEAARRFSCVDRPYHPSKNPEDPGLIFFSGTNCSGDALVYVPFESETNSVWDPGPVFYRLRQPNADTSVRPNPNFDTTAIPPVYETQRFINLSPSQSQTWSQIIAPANRAAQFPAQNYQQLGDTGNFPVRVNQLEAFAHFLEILDRKIYSISEPSSGATERRLAFRRAVRFRYRDHQDMSQSESLSLVSSQPYRSFFPGGVGGPFDPYFDDGNRVQSAGGKQPGSYLSESILGSASTCTNLSAGDTHLHSVYLKNGVTPTRRGRFYYADLLPSDARRYAGRILRQYRDISLVPANQLGKKFSKVEKWEGWSWKNEDALNLSATALDHAMTFPVTRGRHLLEDHKGPFTPKYFLHTEVTDPSLICRVGQEPLVGILQSGCSGGTLSLGGNFQETGSMACPLVQPDKHGTPVNPDSYTRIRPLKPSSDSDAEALRQLVLEGHSMIPSSAIEPNNAQAPRWIQVFSSPITSSGTQTPMTSLPTSNGGSYSPVSAGIQDAKVSCDVSGAVCACGVRFKSDVAYNPNWSIKCVPPVPPAGGIDSRCKLRSLKMEDTITVHEQWREDAPSDESGFVRGLFCGRSESLFALGRNRSHFSAMPQRYINAAYYGPSGDDRPDHHSCLRHLFPSVISTNPSRQVGPVQNPIPALEAMGDGIIGGAMACSNDALAIRKVGDYATLFPATLRLPALQALYVGQNTSAPDLTPWRNSIPTSSTWLTMTYSRQGQLGSGLASLINNDSQHLIPNTASEPHKRGLALGLLNPYSAALDPGAGPEEEHFVVGSGTFIAPAIPVNYGRCVQFKGLGQHPAMPLGPYAFPLRNYLLVVLQLNLADDGGVLPNPARCTNVPWKGAGSGRDAFKLH